MERRIHIGENISMLQPGENHNFYEVHGFSPDDKKLIFSASMHADKWTGMDIYVLYLENGNLERLTHTPNEWDEHAHFSPDGKKIIWASSHDYEFKNLRNLRLELWVMDADGSNKTRLTHFNEPGYPEYTGVKTVVGDCCWSPDGDKILLKIQMRELKKVEKICLLEFVENTDISIVKPKENWLYAFNREIIPFRQTVIIGGIDIETIVYGEVNKVEFYVDNELKYVDEEPPYSWQWNEKVIGKYEIRVVAEEAMDSMEVIIFTF